MLFIKSILLIMMVITGFFQFERVTMGAATQMETKHELVIILHGYGRTARHMRNLRAYFTDQGYDVYAPTLPTFFRSVEACSHILDNRLKEKNLTDYKRVHFVGHSMGGLIIRQYLADHNLPNAGRCVLIGTPNHGTDLGKIVKDWLVPLSWVSPAIESFQPGGKEIPPPANIPPPLMGAIAGSKGFILLSWMITGTDDGRVPITSVPFPGMDDFTILPFSHDVLPYRIETAEAAELFIRKGTFTDNSHSDNL